MKHDETRPSKRERTRSKILANAIAIFRKKGMRAARLADVAAASEVVEATLFNHFPTKAQLAEGWVRGELEAEMASAFEARRTRASPLRPALRRLGRSVAEIAAPEPALRLEAWRMAGRARSGSSFERRGVATLVEAIRGEQEREHVRGDIPAEALAILLLDAVEGGMIAGLEVVTEREACESFDETVAELIRSIQRRIDLVLDGARKRNERVRPRKAST